MKHLQNLAKNYLVKKGYHIRPSDMPKPKVGDTITFRTGGAWSHNSYYEETATVTKFDHDHPERPFEKYGYMYYEKRDKRGVVVAHGVVHPFEIISVQKERGGE